MTPFVLLISNGFQPSYEKGFANGLAANDVRVELISSDRTLVDDLHPKLQVNNLRGSQNPGRSRYTKAANLIRYALALLLRIRAGRHDIVHLVGLFMTRSQIVGLLEWMTYRLFARQFFMTVHNLLPHNRHTRLNRMLYRVLYRLPDRLVVHTEKMKAGLIEQFGVPVHRIVVMQHGVDELPGKLNSPAPSSTLRILLFGGLSPYKGADLLIEAMQHVQDVPIALVIAGECRDQAYRLEVEQLLSNLGGNHTVQWERRFIAESEVGHYFESADVAVLPYRHIDQSGVLFTAYRFGTPVIATDVGAFRDCLPSYAGMLVPEVSVTAVANTLREFHARKQEFDRELIQQYAQSMTWPNTVLPLINTYRMDCDGR
jgi:glycosyltransferase involved in cell wall biosynthesis